MVNCIASYVMGRIWWILGATLLFFIAALLMSGFNWWFAAFVAGVVLTGALIVAIINGYLSCRRITA